MRHNINQRITLIITALYLIAMTAVTVAQEEAAAATEPTPDGLGLLVLLLGVGGVLAVGFFINARDSVRQSENNS